jgi:P-type Mg2+ transporter
LRDGSPREIPAEDIVPEDIILLRAGDVIPGYCLLVEARDLFADEAALTGETFPVEKTVGTLTAGTPLGQRTNVLFLGTYVVGGTGKAVAVHTGKDTEFGQASQRMSLRPLETEFEKWPDCYSPPETGARLFGSTSRKSSPVAPCG